MALHFGAPTVTADQAAVQVAQGGASAKVGLEALMRRGRFGLDALIRLSRRSEGDSLRRVYEAIGAFRGEKALGALSEGVSVLDVDGQLGAVRGLGRLGSAKAVQPLLQTAFSRNVSIRRAVVDSLSRIGGPAAKQASKLRSSSSAYARETAVRFLARFYDGEKRKKWILTGLRDSDANVRGAAVEMIELWKDMSLAESLTVLTRDKDAQVASRAVEAISKFPAMRKTLPDLLADSRVTRQAWMTAFHKMRDYDDMAIPYLLAALTRASPQRRHVMLDILSEDASQGELGAFVDMLDTPNADVGKIVTGLLEQMGARADTAAARMILSKRESLVEAIRGYLGTRPRNGITDEILEGAREGTVESRQIHLQIIGELNVSAVRDELVDLLEDANSEVRMSALRTIGGLQDLGSEAELVRLLDDVNTEVRVEAIKGLKESDSDLSVLARMSVLGDGEPKVRDQALESFKGAEPNAVLRALERVVRTGSHAERIDALSAIAELRSKMAVVTLVDLVTDSEPDIFKAAVGYFDSLPELEPIYEHAGDGMDQL